MQSQSKILILISSQVLEKYFKIHMEAQKIPDSQK